MRTGLQASRGRAPGSLRAASQAGPTRRELLRATIFFIAWMPRFQPPGKELRGQAGRSHRIAVLRSPAPAPLPLMLLQAQRSLRRVACARPRPALASSSSEAGAAVSLVVYHAVAARTLDGVLEAPRQLQYPPNFAHTLRSKLGAHSSLAVLLCPTRLARDRPKVEEALAERKGTFHVFRLLLHLQRPAAPAARARGPHERDDGAASFATKLHRWRRRRRRRRRRVLATIER